MQSSKTDYYFIIRTYDKLEETVKKWQDHGYQVSGASVLDIDYLDCHIPNVADNHSFIFTSQYGIKGLRRFFTPQLTHQAFCIGEHTAQQASLAGFSNIHVPNIHNAEHLAHLIKEKYTIGSPFLYCTGLYRKPHLENFLKQYAIPYKLLEVYGTKPIDTLPDTIQKRIYNHSNHSHLVCFSIRNAEVFYNLAQKSPLLHDIWNNMHWHIVGSISELTIQLSNSLFYSTPKDLYQFFCGNNNENIISV